MWGRKPKPSESESALRSALVGSMFELRSIVEVPVTGTPLVALAVPVTADELEQAWGAARALLPVTGRWPLAVIAWQPRKDWEASIAQADFFSRFFFDEAVPRLSASETLAAADALGAEDVDAFVATSLDECLEFEREYDQPFPLVESLPDPWHAFTEPAALLFLPWERGWDSLAYISFWDSGTRGIPEIIALGRRWEERYGAELVAHFDTMLECLVSRPPSTPDEAVTVAREHFAVAPDTFYLPGEPPAQISPALINAQRWLLHQRP